MARSGVCGLMDWKSYYYIYKIVVGLIVLTILLLIVIATL